MLSAELRNEFLVKVGETIAPLPKLLELIEARKLSINEISLAQVTDEFLNFYSNKKLSKSVLSDFVDIASTLILIKSRSLLPELPLVDEEEDSEELQRRLKALKLLKAQKEKVKEKFKDNKSFKILSFKIFKKEIEFKDPDFSLQEIFAVKNKFKDLESQSDKDIKIKRRKLKSVEEFMKMIEKSLRKNFRLSFSELNFKNKEEKALSFLAVLELIKKGEVEARLLGGKDFLIEQVNIKMPHYE